MSLSNRHKLSSVCATGKPTTKPNWRDIHTHEPEWNQYAAFNIRSLYVTNECISIKYEQLSLPHVEYWVCVWNIYHWDIAANKSRSQTARTWSIYAFAHWKISLGSFFRSVFYFSISGGKKRTLINVRLLMFDSAKEILMIGIYRTTSMGISTSQ